MEAAYRKNPNATMTELRRGSNSKEARAENALKKGDKDLDSTAYSKQNIRKEISRQTVREKLGVITPQAATEARTILKEMEKNIVKKYEKLVAGSNADLAMQETIRQQRRQLQAEYGLFQNYPDMEDDDIMYH